MSNALTTFKQFNKCREIQYCFFLDFCHCQMSSVPVFEIWSKTAWIGFGHYNSTSFSTALESYYFTEMTTRCFFEHQPLKPSEQPHSFDKSGSASFSWLPHAVRNLPRGAKLWWKLFCLQAEMVGLNALQGILFSLSSVMWTKFIHCGLGST